METLKDLDKLSKPDPRNELMIALDSSAPEGFRKLTAADRHRDMAALELPESVPERVRSAFAVARTLWVHGWFYWPFFTIAGFHAIQCLDLALALRIAMEEGRPNPDPRTPPLRKMLERAIESNWIKDEGIAHARRPDGHRMPMWQVVCHRRC